MTLQLVNLPIAMRRAAMNQADIARVTGWSKAKVSRLVSGKTGDITMVMVAELARKLGTTPAFLLDIQDVAQDDAERELLRNYRAAQERDRAVARAAVVPRD